MNSCRQSQNKFIDQNNIFEEPELKGLKLLYILCAFLLITDIVMPQYFGVHLGYDLTCTRLGNLLILIYMIMNPKVFHHFIFTSVRCQFTVPLLIYLFVGLYTMVLRVDVNAFFLIFFEALTLWMLVYAIRFVIGYRKAFEWIISASYFFGVLGIIDYARGRSTMLQFLSTLPSPVTDVYRSGNYRIMGPCGHALGYGLLLILLIALSCVDLEHNEVFLFRRPLLIGLLYINVFLTGSRSTLGIAILEACVIILFSNYRNVKKTILFLTVAILALGVFLLLFHGTSIGNYIMMQLASVIDQFMGTEYAAMFGAETTRLQDSEAYRKMLPLIFKLDWLNPLLGRGVKRGFSAVINGASIISIDNYYIAQYIKYAYPGMITYIVFIVVVLVYMLVAIKKTKSALAKMTFVGTVCYYINLWWLDALQTLKYEYIVIALLFAYILTIQDEGERGVANGKQ